MRILISTHVIGGAGGAERALFSVLHALGDDQVDVVIRETRDGVYAQHGAGARVFDTLNWRWRWAGLASGYRGKLVRFLINPVRRRLLPSYDMYIQFWSGPSVGDTIRSRARLLIPSGNDVPAELAAQFDAVALQAPGNSRFVPAGASSVLLPPPVLPLEGGDVELPHNLPDRYLLTVFNPYGPIKGLDDLKSSLDEMPHPLVWCHSQATLNFEIPRSLQEHPRLIHVDDPSHATMRELYKNCEAYVSFSRSEGFGWSIADALRYSPQIVSRKIGVLTFPEAEDSDIVEVPAEWSVDWGSVRPRPRPPADLDWLSPGQFRQRLVELVKVAD